MKHTVLLIIMSLLFIQCVSVKQKVKSAPKTTITTTKNVTKSKPKLVVGIVVDQMRYDYLTRFKGKYGDGGFMRMLQEGYNCKNTHYNYIPTYTGPGHASVYTGTTPENHGIIANDWYDKYAKKEVYCASDPNQSSVGVEGQWAGKMSPHRMQTTTVTDQLRLDTQKRGKVIGIAIKDRGAILPAGHAANGAYWFYGKAKGDWITSTYYTNELPGWVQRFNAADKAEKYLKTWNTMYDINSYVESDADLNAYEATFKGKANATFPYELANLQAQNGGFDILKATPYGNSLTTDFAIAAILGENLGKDEHTDFLAVSYSSTDYVGHRFGVNSVEIQDTYLRLDKDLERLFATLDTEVGKGNYTIFLTADHAAVHVPSFLQDMKIPAGYFNHGDLKKHLTDFLNTTFGSDKLIENMSSGQIFLDHTEIQKHNLSAKAIENALQRELLNYDKIAKVYTRNTLMSSEFTYGIAAAVQRGFNQKRSGDVCYVLDIATISYSRTGSTHGTGFNYDTHVPLLFYGNGIQQGETLQRFNITDIAPTISALLEISLPNAATGNPIESALKH
ncbi:type I phosphodiesterase/nucleotide pyrophosphatase [Kordia periserrulae]|uniref:Type I phosphodiesterase/nucleotide pyrophosphatase n=1 Tax=Kordia periserrulae TaxID=701523 RepID=A0A2T6BXU6_9FLAO|nr:alkaline phosphatase PafA [Kordia periserrulae]PTX60902.1 type I phosphodiesterase/nucleotide pyrophosphatase [Kordia periserrulae]